jgi:predicted transcriptional regulator
MARFTIDGDQQFDAKLEQLSELRHVSKAEIVRRALALYFSVESNMNIGDRLLVANSENQPIKELVLP